MTPKRKQNIIFPQKLFYLRNDRGLRCFSFRTHYTDNELIWSSARHPSDLSKFSALLINTFNRIVTLLLMRIVEVYRESEYSLRLYLVNYCRDL